MCLGLRVPDTRSKMALPYIFMSFAYDPMTPPTARVPWFASQEEMLADDWVIVN